MPRFFVAASNIGNGAALLTGSDAQHVKVLRMKLGERLVICDGNGTDHHRPHYQAWRRLCGGGDTGNPPMPCRAYGKMYGACGLPQRGAFRLPMQKCTEVGASK